MKKRSNHYIDGRSSKKYYCKDCNRKIGWLSGFRGGGRCCSCAAKRRIKINGNPMKNKQHSIKTRELISKILSDGRLKGKNNPRYINGKGREPYSSEFSNFLKEEIRKRDNYTCQLCGLKESRLKGFFKKLDIHHIDYNKKNCKNDNLISLCRSCNGKVNMNRPYWIKYFRKKIKDIINN